MYKEKCNFDWASFFTLFCFRHYCIKWQQTQLYILTHNEQFLDHSPQSTVKWPSVSLDGILESTKQTVYIFILPEPSISAIFCHFCEGLWLELYSFYSYILRYGRWFYSHYWCLVRLSRPASVYSEFSAIFKARFFKKEQLQIKSSNMWCHGCRNTSTASYSRRLGWTRQCCWEGLRSRKNWCHSFIHSFIHLSLSLVCMFCNWPCVCKAVKESWLCLTVTTIHI
jgi:hypothetical protein